jgi:predicted HAD superfamily Cof-like phosphohydrolase
MENYMSTNWVKDINQMHAKFGVHNWMEKKLAEKDYESINTYLKFRIDFLKEELSETSFAFSAKDPEEIVDGLIDLCVVAIGTLDAFGVDAHKAWDSVHEANMAKEPGIKPSRPNPLGLPDLIKPKCWTAPSHEGNHGHIPNSF